MEVEIEGDISPSFMDKTCNVTVELVSRISITSFFTSLEKNSHSLVCLPQKYFLELWRQLPSQFTFCQLPFWIALSSFGWHTLHKSASSFCFCFFQKCLVSSDNCQNKKVLAMLPSSIIQYIFILVLSVWITAWDNHGNQGINKILPWLAGVMGYDTLDKTSLGPRPQLIFPHSLF